MTYKNKYFEPEDFSKLRYKLTTDGTYKVMDESDYIKLSEELILSKDVPDIVSSLIDDARLLFCYGYVVNRFFTIALEKAIFAFEKAISYKYKNINGPRYIKNNQKANFQYMIDYLYKNKYLPNDIPLNVFHAFREERNNIAHTNEFKGIESADLTISFGFIKILIVYINYLFD